MNVARPIFPTAADCPPQDAGCAHLAGLRAVAALEMFKGLLAIAAGIGLFTLLHKDIGDVAENIVEALHLNPAHHMAQAFIRAADNVSDNRIIAFACVAFLYSAIRFVEGYGLWNARVWAEWFAIVSGAIYLPWEIVEVIKHHGHLLRWAVLVVNILVVLYMIYVRWDTLKEGKRLGETADREHVTS